MRGQRENRRRSEDHDVFVYRSIAIAIAQQGDQVGFLLLAATAGSHRHDPAADEILWTTERLSLRRLRLHNQHIAIRQRVNRAWVGEVFGVMLSP